MQETYQKLPGNLLLWSFRGEISSKLPEVGRGFVLCTWEAGGGGRGRLKEREGNSMHLVKEEFKHTWRLVVQPKHKTLLQRPICILWQCSGRKSFWELLITYLMETTTACSWKGSWGWIGGWGRWKVDERQDVGLGGSNQIWRIMCKSFLLSSMSFESPVIFHSPDCPVFAIPKMTVAHDHFLVHDSVLNIETMHIHLPPETVSYNRMTAYFWAWEKIW